MFLDLLMQLYLSLCNIHERRYLMLNIDPVWFSLCIRRIYSCFFLVFSWRLFLIFLMDVSRCFNIVTSSGFLDVSEAKREKNYDVMALKKEKETKCLKVKKKYLLNSSFLKPIKSQVHLSKVSFHCRVDDQKVNKSFFY